jgi:Fe2+ or Zn2+ uptake regulation protein
MEVHILKYSRQRELILETLKQMTTHPTAEELYEEVKKQMSSVSLGTVYRNLALLVERDIVKKLEAAGSSSVRYEVNHHDHSHFICTKCGKVIDATDDMFERHDIKIKEDVGFTLFKSGTVYKGICKECSSK